MKGATGGCNTFSSAAAVVSNADNILDFIAMPRHLAALAILRDRMQRFQVRWGFPTGLPKRNL